MFRPQAMILEDHDSRGPDCVGEERHHHPAIRPCTLPPPPTSILWDKSFPLIARADLSPLPELAYCPRADNGVL